MAALAARMVRNVRSVRGHEGRRFRNEALDMLFLQRPPKGAYLALWPNLSLLAATAETVRRSTTLFESRRLHPSVTT